MDCWALCVHPGQCGPYFCSAVRATLTNGDSILNSETLINTATLINPVGPHDSPCIFGVHTGSPLWGLWSFTGMKKQSSQCSTLYKLDHSLKTSWVVFPGALVMSGPASGVRYPILSNPSPTHLHIQPIHLPFHHLLIHHPSIYPSSTRSSILH